MLHYSRDFQYKAVSKIPKESNKTILLLHASLVYVDWFVTRVVSNWVGIYISISVLSKFTRKKKKKKKK